MNTFSPGPPGARGRSLIWRMALVAAVGLSGTVGAAAAHAEITTGRIAGTTTAGASVVVSSDHFGIHRKVQTNAKGRYRVGWLPIGEYTVTVLDKNGQPLVEHRGVPVMVDSGARVDFRCPYGQCQEVAQH